MLSSDVSAAYDPLFASCFREDATVHISDTGSYLISTPVPRGKGEQQRCECRVHRSNPCDDGRGTDVAFQTAELGKIDVGGGGTIAYITALYGMEVIDSGVAVLNMHAPLEVTSKADVYEAYTRILCVLAGGISFT